MDEQFFLNYEVSSEKRKAFDVMLDMLKKFIQVCKENNLTYYAYAGTLLGAVRHIGFIPWDDDIDILMPRKDFDEFCLIATKAFSEPYYFQSSYTDHVHVSPHVKIRNSNTACINNTSFLYNNSNQGIFISIFPLDGVVGISEANKQRKRIKICKHLLVINRFLRKKKARSLVSYFCKLASLFFIVFKPEMISRRIYMICSKYDIDEVNYVCNLVSPNYAPQKVMWHKELYCKTVEVDFEDVKIAIPSGYDQVLRIMYGDYMKPPKSITDIHTHSVILDVEKSYTYYKAHPEIVCKLLEKNKKKYRKKKEKLVRRKGLQND